MALFNRQKRRIRRLLIVEDEPIVAFDNEYGLSNAGYDVVATVDRGDLAIAHLDRDRVDLVILDMHLAGAIGGLDVARAAAQRGVAVLFATATDAAMARDVAVAWLAKPYNPAALIAALRAIDAVLCGDNPPAATPGLTMFCPPAQADVTP
ncbi:MAG: response regulator, partial [Sphingopyxis sp.]